MVTIILFMNPILWRHDVQAVNYKTEVPVFEFRGVLISSIDFLKNIQLISWRRSIASFQKSERLVCLVN